MAFLDLWSILHGAAAGSRSPTEKGRAMRKLLRIRYQRGAFTLASWTAAVRGFRGNRRYHPTLRISFEPRSSRAAWLPLMVPSLLPAESDLAWDWNEESPWGRKTVDNSSPAQDLAWAWDGVRHGRTEGEARDWHSPRLEQ